MISTKLDPNILPKQVGGLKAERVFHRVTFTPSTARPGETLYISVPRLSENISLVPGTLALRFDLKIQPDTKIETYCVNNIARNIVSRMRVKFEGETLLDLNRFDLYQTYKDLFIRDKIKDEMIEWGIGSVDLRKVRSGTKTQPSNKEDEDALKTAFGTKYVIPLDFAAVWDHGIFYSRALAELQFEVTLADTTNILQQDAAKTALSGSIHPYAMTNLELQYETIHSDTLARSAASEYTSGKAFLYEHVVLYKTFTFMDKTDELITQSINIPRRSLVGLLLLFIKPHKAGLRDSEAFANPQITKVGVNVNGIPNKVYSQGITPPDIYREVLRRYGSDELGSVISPTQFFHENKYALWIDMRTSGDNSIHGQGLRLVNTQDGIALEIRRTKNGSAGDSDKFNAYIFVVSDAQLSIEGGQLKSVAGQLNSKYKIFYRYKMLRIFENAELNAEVQTVVKGDKFYFKGKNICDALGYENSRKALTDHVSVENKVRLGDLKGGTVSTTLANAQPHTVFINEFGLYELIFGSELPSAKEFRKWVFEDVRPTIRKTGKYEAFNGKNQLVFKIENEEDLHSKVVNYLRRFYPQVIHIAGLGELQDTSDKRIKSWKKGYIKGQPDLIIANHHKHYSGFCIEFKTPKGNGVTSEAQKKVLDAFKTNGYKTLISNDYDVIIQEIVEYCRGIRIPCPYSCKKFVKDITLKAHLKWFHRID